MAPDDDQGEGSLAPARALRPQTRDMTTLPSRTVSEEGNVLQPFDEVSLAHQSHSGSQWAAPSGKLIGSPCEWIGWKLKLEKPDVAVKRATNPLFSVAGPLPESEK